MESRNVATVLEPSGEDVLPLETVKNIATQNELDESTGMTEDDFTRDQGERCPGESVEKTTPETNDEGNLVWIHLCRTCANTCDNLIPIFGDQKTEHGSLNKILKHLPIHISESDTLPLQLCQNCVDTLLAWDKLSEGCLSAEKKLLKMQETLQNKQQYPASLSNFEDSTMNATTPTIASNTTDLQLDLQIAVKNEIHDTDEINKSNRWTCRVSNEKERHVGDNSQRIYESKTEKWSVNVGMVYSTISSKKCLSLTHFDDLDERLESQNNHSDRSEKREKFQKSDTTNSRGDTERHEQTFEHKHAELTPSKMTKNGCIYKCKECGKILSTSYNLLIHCNIHTGARPYNCSICEKSFRSASNMNRHVRDVHGGVKNFVCDVCGRRLASRASRDEHKRTHTDERPHTCEICGKSFKQKASLHVHRLYHSQVLPHHCDLCDRSFRRKQDLDKHVSWHSNKKPYICNICDERFRSERCAVRHRRIHTDRRTHICTICSARFTQERYLKRHCENFHKAVHV